MSSTKHCLTDAKKYKKYSTISKSTCKIFIVPIFSVDKKTINIFNFYFKQVKFNIIKDYNSSKYYKRL